MDNRTTNTGRLAQAVGFMTVVIALLTPAGCGTNTNSSIGNGSISGTVTDSSGAPVAGATVVAGSSSPTGMTDLNGNFAISGVPAGPVSVTTLAEGYQANIFSVQVENNDVTTLAYPIALADEDNIDEAPLISNVNLQATGTAISVTATIQPGVSGNGISDARAELLGYGTGTRMTGNGFAYSGTIAIPVDFPGPSALVEIFAVDTKGRVCVTAATVAVSGAPGSGNFSESTFSGDWAGHAVYPRAPFGDKDRVGDKRAANVALTVSGTSVSGAYADIVIEKFIPASSWSISKTSFTGKMTLINSNLGIYKITSTFNPTGTRTVDLTILGKLNSASTPTHFIGFFKAAITDTAPQTGRTAVFGRVHLVKGLAWSDADLDGNWVWSEFIKDCQSSCASSFTYLNPFQYNSSFAVASGTISNGLDSLGNTLNTDKALSVTDSNLGIFSGSFKAGDGSIVTVTGLIGSSKKHVTGLFNVSQSPQTAYGAFWGNKIANPPHFALTDFGQRKIDAVNDVAVWRGLYYVTGGPDPGTLCYLSLWTKSDGSVGAGAISPILGSSCPSVIFNSGSLSFTDTTLGQIAGSATGGDTTFTLAPPSSRNASMGVEKARLVGDFSVNVDADHNDTGFFFLQRAFIE